LSHSVWFSPSPAPRTARPTTINLATTLNASQEVPAPNGDVAVARGTFTATVNASATGATVAWELTFSALTGAAGAAHIHIAPRGTAGPIAVPLCGPCQSPASGTANVSATVLEALQTAGAYVNVHTATNAPGEIRGQLGVRANVTTALKARQEVSISWRLTFSKLTGRATAAHIHTGATGRSGPVALPLCGPCRSGVRKAATVQSSLLAALEAGRAYVNIHTARNPAGEIRGQIRAVPLSIS